MAENIEIIDCAPTEPPDWNKMDSYFKIIASAISKLSSKVDKHKTPEPTDDDLSDKSSESNEDDRITSPYSVRPVRTTAAHMGSSERPCGMMQEPLSINKCFERSSGKMQDPFINKNPDSKGTSATNSAKGKAKITKKNFCTSISVSSCEKGTFQ